MYRIPGHAGEVRERRDQARHPAYTKPELVARGAESDLVVGHHEAERADRVIPSIFRST